MDREHEYAAESKGDDEYKILMGIAFDADERRRDYHRSDGPFDDLKGFRSAVDHGGNEGQKTDRACHRERAVQIERQTSDESNNETEGDQECI